MRVPPSARDDATGAVTPSPLATVFAPAFLRQLERLRLRTGNALGHRHGRTPTARGVHQSGMEVARHKPYAPGDDLRHLDWNALGRLDQPVVKIFRAEREVPLHLLLDCSASMGVPAADGTLAFAAALAAGLAYVALRQRDPVRLVCLGAGGDAFRASGLLRHPQRLPDLRTDLETIAPHGPTRLAEGVEAYLRTTHAPGVAILLSDFLVPPATYEAALTALCAARHTTAALCLSGPSERVPGGLAERVLLRDAETGATRRVRLTPAARAAYQAARQAHRDTLQRWCDSRGITFVPLDTDAGIETCLFSDLPRAGVLQ